MRGQCELSSDAQVQSILGVLLPGDSRKQHAQPQISGPWALGGWTGAGALLPSFLHSHSRLHFLQARAHCHGIHETQARPGGKSVFNFWPAWLQSTTESGGGGGCTVQSARRPHSLFRERGGLSAGHWTLLLTCGVKGVLGTSFALRNQPHLGSGNLKQRCKLACDGHLPGAGLARGPGSAAGWELPLAGQPQRGGYDSSHSWCSWAGAEP